MRAFFLLIALALPIFLYNQSTAYSFVYDDILQIEHNPYVTSAESSLRAFLEIFLVPTPPGNLYRPLATITYKLNYLFGGLDPFWYHITNIALYLVSLVVFYLVLVELAVSSMLSFVILLLFAVHPLHVEGVANIVGRAEVLAAIFGSGMLIFFLRALSSSSSSIRTGMFLLAGVSFLLATWSKESALTLLGVVPFAIIYSKRKPRSFGAIFYGIFVLLSASIISLLFRKGALGSQFVISSDGVTIWPENPLFHLSFWERLVPAIKILGDYLYLTLLPIGLSADYSMMPDEFLLGVYSAQGIGSIAFVAATLALTWLQRRTVAGFFGVWFFVTFALTSNILTPIGTIMGDRLAYVPSFGAIGLYLVTVSNVIQTKASLFFVRSLVICYALFLSLITFGRTQLWKNNQVLFSQTLLDSPRSPKAYYNYGVYLMGEEKNLEEAEAYFRQVLVMHPTHLRSMKNIADIALERKKYAKVEYWYRRILEAYPNQEGVKDRLSKLIEFKASSGANRP